VSQDERDVLQPGGSQDLYSPEPLDALYLRSARMLAGEYGWSYVLQLVGKPVYETDRTARGTKHREKGTKRSASQSKAGVRFSSLFPFSVRKPVSNKKGTTRSADKDAQPLLPSWVPDLRNPLLPKPFWFYGCTHFRAATYVKPTMFDVGECSRDDPSNWTLAVLAAQVDVVEQVGESFAELNIYNFSRLEGHMLDLISKLKYEYQPAREMGRWETSMDAVLRSMTGDIFKRRPQLLRRFGDPSSRMRDEFEFYLDGIFGLGEFTRDGVPRDQSSIWWKFVMWLGNNVMGYKVDTPAATINNANLVLRDAVKSFEAHFSNVYPMPVSEGYQRMGRMRPATDYLVQRYRRRSHGDEPQKEHGAKPDSLLKDRLKADVRRKDCSGCERRSSVPPILPSMRAYATARETLPAKCFRPIWSEENEDNVCDDESYFSDGPSDGDTERLPFIVSGFIKLLMQKPAEVTTAINSIYRDRRIFRTRDKNYVGICHDSTAKGDMVVLIAGAEVPFVLRQDSKTADRFTLVGAAYVHGIMYGELIEATPDTEFSRHVLA